MDNIGEDIKLLIVGYLTNDINQQDVLRLMQWINANDENREEFNRIKTSWGLADKKNDFERFNTDKSWQDIEPELGKGLIFKNSKGYQILKIAATWILLLALGSILTLLINHKKETFAKSDITEIISPLGARSIVKLPDGTKVWLNAGSKLVYNSGFNSKDRVVQLTGEAFFHVKTDKSKPFIVKTSDVVVRALGTRFNVKAYPDEKTITATLEEGKIDVQITSAANQEKILLKPNENIIFYKGDKGHANISKGESVLMPKPEKVKEKVEIQEHVKTILYTSWKEDKWIIEGEPLSTLIPKLERKFNLTISFSDAELMNYKFSGSIKNETVEQILKALSFTAPVEYSIDKDKIVLRLNQQLKDKFTRIITHKTETN